MTFQTFPALAQDMVATADGAVVFTLGIAVAGATVAMVSPP